MLITNMQICQNVEKGQKTLNSKTAGSRNFRDRDVTVPTTLEQRTKERSGNTNWIHSSRVSVTFAHKLVHLHYTASRGPPSPDLPRCPCKDTRASARTPCVLSHGHFKVYPWPYGLKCSYLWILSPRGHLPPQTLCSKTAGSTPTNPPLVQPWVKELELNKSLRCGQVIVRR